MFFCVGFFHSASFSQGSCVFLHVSELHSFLCPRSISLDGYILLCLSSHPQATFRLSPLFSCCNHAAADTGVQVSGQVPAFSLPRSGIARPSSSSILAFWTIGQLFSWKGHSALWYSFLLEFISLRFCSILSRCPSFPVFWAADLFLSPLTTCLPSVCLGAQPSSFPHEPVERILL